MTTLELLSTVEERGVVARHELTDSGEPTLVLFPRSKVTDLLPALQEAKPRLLELIPLSCGTILGIQKTLANLARLRNPRRFGFGPGGQRIFHPEGRHVALNPELITAWKQAEAATGKRLTVWGTEPQELLPIPDEITLVEYGQAQTQCQRHRSLWCSMTREEQHQFTVCTALLRAGYDPISQEQDN